jgi:hypothetical protein
MDKTTTPAPFIEETAVELDEMATLDKLAAGDPVTAAFFETDTTAVTALTRLFLEVTGIPVEKVDEFSVFHIEAGNGAITATAALGTLRMTVALKEDEIAALRTPALAGRKLAERLAEAANPIIRAMHGLETSPVVALDDAGTHQEPRATPQSTQDVEDDGFVTIYPAIREGLVEIRETTSLARAQVVATALLAYLTPQPPVPDFEDVMRVKALLDQAQDKAAELTKLGNLIANGGDVK